MYSPRLLTCLVSTWLAAVSLGSAATPRDELLVTTVWLAEHLADPSLVLLHVGEKPEYDTQHIPGARYVNLRADLSVSDPTGSDGTLEMLPADVLRERLAGLGISDTSQVVVYYGKDWVSPSTRVIITLLNAGLTRVALLDGGMPAWTGEGRPTSAAIPAAPPRGSLTAVPPPRPLVVDAAFVLEHAKKRGYAVIDARNAEFYEGTRTGGSPERPHKAGHIPGARSVPFTDVTSEDLRLKSPAELSAAFARAGVRPGDIVIAYCHIGQQATAVMFAARTLGHPVLLYDGSFEDWSRRDLPVDAGPAPR